MTAPTPRPGIMDIRPYVGGESALEGVSRVIKLSSNEGALGPSPKAMEAFRAQAADMHRYPDGGATRLRAALAARWGVDAERIVCGAGSDELLGMLCRAYAGPGDEVLYSAHGFLMYAIAAKSCGATPVTAPEVDLTASVDNLLAAVTPRTKILFLANPNNPTGTYLSADEVARLRAGLRPDILLVIDAAYAEFVSKNDYTPGIELVDGSDNTVMCRTFSKIFALGGLRLGWAYCPPGIADVLNRVRNPFNVAAPSLAAGVAALEDTAFADLTKTHNDYWLPWMQAELAKLGLPTTQSVCNFVLVQFPKEEGRTAQAADACLRAQGIITRAMGGYGLPDWLRITVGTGEENQMVIAAIAAFQASWN
ncbi:histidinol-phosphate aminotransferase [Magnetospirillum gryphiswaldense MSR-1 v2]|uniref:Histidinol-phosphate aminotransferase n=2 Tax=Magnetospirillum gryphiswaldense TaxID=55518 RepID=V6F791_MAGGM|nr:histidinol-phosphate transaminase [Magnetospirillum gryphiswaldense]CDL01380.1 histidinol-phosphate aminotransferase [Magnetospirillum gryphiswaldense MSR-1 v2]